MATQSDAVAGAAQPSMASGLDTTSETLRAPNEGTSEMAAQPSVSPLTPHDEFKDAVSEQRHNEPVEVSPVEPVSTTSQPTATASSSEQQSEAPAMTRRPTEALGPATDGPIVPPSASAVAGPTLNISLLLQNGNRHPYKIDERYLRNRKVEARNSSTGDFDPKEISGYQLKELIWTDWRSEWEPRPASPSSIRLIHMGKLIEDKAALKDARFNMDSSNVVHMTVKPAELEQDDETGGKGAGKSGVLRQRDAEDRGSGCRCIIM